MAKQKHGVDRADDIVCPLSELCRATLYVAKGGRSELTAVCGASQLCMHGMSRERAADDHIDCASCHCLGTKSVIPTPESWP